MPIDMLSGTFSVRSRAQIRDKYLRDYRFRIPDADTSEQTQPYVDASCFADGLMPTEANAQLVALATSILTSKGKDLDDDGAELGVPRRPAEPSVGYLVCVASIGGALVTQGDQFRYSPSNLVLSCLTTKVYQSGDLIPVQALTTGPATNLPGGTSVTVTNPGPGLVGTLLVFTNTDGSGLSGGADAESDDSYRARLIDHLQTPPADGNEQAVVEVLEKIAGLAVEKGYVVPAIFGPGTKAVFFTVPPASQGASRQPNAAQLAIAQAAVEDAFSGDDGYFLASGSDHLVRVSVKVTWNAGGAGWVDAVPWPPFQAAPVLVMASAAPGAMDVGVASSTITAPTPGNSIALYNSVTRTFAVKRILTVTPVTPNVRYTLTFDMTTPGASDPTFVAAVAAIVSPWSPSASSIVAPILSYVDAQGPGEMVASFSDPGRRQRRYPPPAPNAWPSKIENRMVDGLFAFVSDAVIVEPTIPFATTVGTPGTLFYLHRTSDIGVFAE